MVVSVVGNAKSLFGKRDGHIIDQGDEVIRFNNASIIKPLSQGTKITILAYSYVKKNKNKFFKNFDTHIKYWCIVEDDNLLKIRKKLQKILDARPSNGIVILEKLKIDYASDDIQIFGFDWKQSRTWYHTSVNNETYQHNYLKEKEYCLALIKEMNWKLY